MLCVLTVATLYFRDTRKPTVSLSAVGKSDLCDVGIKQHYCCMPLLLFFLHASRLRHGKVQKGHHV